MDKVNVMVNNAWDEQFYKRWWTARVVWGRQNDIRGKALGFYSTLTSRLSLPTPATQVVTHPVFFRAESRLPWASWPSKWAMKSQGLLFHRLNWGGNCHVMDKLCRSFTGIILWSLSADGAKGRPYCSMGESYVEVHDRVEKEPVLLYGCEPSRGRAGTSE